MCKYVLIVSAKGTLSHLNLVEAQASIFSGGGGKGQEKFYGQKCKKIRSKRAKTFHLYAEIVKFGLILTHFKLFWGKTEGKIYFFGGDALYPLWRRPCLCLIHKHYKPMNNQYLDRIINLNNSGLCPLLAQSLISYPLTLKSISVIVPNQ